MLPLVQLVEPSLLKDLSEELPGELLSFSKVSQDSMFVSSSSFTMYISVLISVSLHDKLSVSTSSPLLPKYIFVFMYVLDLSPEKYVSDVEEVVVASSGTGTSGGSVSASASASWEMDSSIMWKIMHLSLLVPSSREIKR